MKRSRLQHFLAFALIITFALTVRSAQAQDDMSAKDIVNANMISSLPEVAIF